MAESKQQQQLKEITERLEKGVKELFTSEKYMEYLRVMSQFHHYSFSNTLLIAMQKPDATLVAGYGAWQKKFERNVMKGEKAIKIFAPAPRKVEIEQDMLDPETQKPILDENGEVKKEMVTVKQPFFKITSVFDVSQTEGKPLPELDTVKDLTASVEEYNIFFEALKRTSKVPIDFQPIEGSSHGFYHQKEKRIAIAEGMSEAQNIKTGIHEIAHSRLHDVDMTDAENGIMVDRNTREVQAESVAYTVCQYYGIDTSEYSFGYIAGWSEGKEMKELRSSMEVIRREADSMIKEIDRNLEIIRKERQQEMEENEQVTSVPIAESAELKYTPFYQGYLDVKAAYPDSIILYQVGDFFEAFNDDARTIAESLDLQPTSRPISDTERAALVGLPKHNLEYYVEKLQAQGHKITIAALDEGERKVYQMASPQSEAPAIPLTSENTEPSNALKGYSRKDVEEMVLFAAQAELEEMELSESVKLLGARVYGSRTIDGLFEESSDIDVVLSFDAPIGVLYEDTFFNAINGNHLEIGGLSVDVNPISLQETGTLEDYMTRAEAYLDRKELHRAVYAHLANSADREADVLQAARITFPEAKGDTLQEVLQSAAIPKLREQAEVMDGIEVFGHEGVFTNGRVNKKDLPEGLFAYDLRGSDDDPGQFVTIEPFVLVNHAGAVVLSEKLDFGEKDRLEIGEDWTFSGDAGMTLESFYEKFVPGKGEAVYAKDAADIAEKAVAFYGSETKLFDYLGDDRETILTDIVDQLNHCFVAYMDEKSLTAETEIGAQKRFSVVVMDYGSDHAYEVWDTAKNECYVDENGNRAEFVTRWQAEDFASEHNRWVAEHGGIGAEIVTPEIERENAELDAIDDFLNACKIDDITIGFDDGIFSATDGESTWERTEFYEFLLNDVVMLDENEKLVDGFSMRDEVLAPIIQYAKEAGATIHAQSVIKEEPSKPTIVPLSNLTFAEAKEKGEVDAWRASRRETEACAEQFNKEFGMAYHERRMPEFLAEMADKYGMERVKIVLASTIQLADHDGRYYPSTKADAAKVHIPGTNTEDYSKDIRRFYTTNCHPVMINSAFRELQKMERESNKAKESAAVDHDSKPPRTSVLSKLQEKQKVKVSPTRSEDKKRGIEL